MGQARMLTVGAITGGQDVPSARFRVRQYIPELRMHGVMMDELQSRTSAYPPKRRWARPLWAADRLVAMAGVAFQSRRYEVTLLQREMLSTFATLEGWTGRPRVLDVDDSIHLYRGGTTAKTLALRCDRVICGNAHLAEIYGRWNRDVVVLPTAVDTERYTPVGDDVRGEAIVLGWIGTSANLRYLQNIETALASVLSRNPNAVLHVICDAAPKLQSVEPSRVIFTPWSELSEVRAIQSFTVGLMPLEDSPWARGKCSFKMLQYMACGLPVVVSPVGMNAEVLSLGEIGFGAKVPDDWIGALSLLISSRETRRRMGAVGRAVALRDFSLVKLAPRFAGYLRAAGGVK